MIQVGDLYHCRIMDDSGEYFIAMVTKIADDDRYHPITLTCIASYAKWWKVGQTTTRCHNTIKMIGDKIS